MNDDAARQPVCVVVGVGPGNGAAFVRAFADAGYRVAMISRSETLMKKLADELPSTRAYPCNVADPHAVERVFTSIGHDLGPVDVLIYNAGKGVWGSAEQIDVASFEEAWRVNALGAFVAARCVIPVMKEQGGGTIVFIGATASRRGGRNTAAFAPAKAAQKSLAESLARSLGPFGIHVALLVIDGIIDEPTTRARLPDKPDSFFIKPADVAATVLMLARQKPSAWTFELEIRPFGEVW